MSVAWVGRSGQRGPVVRRDARAVEVESIEMHVNPGGVPANRGAVGVAVSATLFRARGTHAVLPASRPDSDSSFCVSAPDGLTSPLHAKRSI